MVGREGPRRDVNVLDMLAVSWAVGQAGQPLGRSFERGGLSLTRDN